MRLQGSSTRPVAPQLAYWLELIGMSVKYNHTEQTDQFLSLKTGKSNWCDAMERI